MSRLIHTSAGFGGEEVGPTDRFGVRGTDLGYLFVGGRGQWVGGVFGDTFDKTDPHAPTPPGGDHWRSPVLGRSGNRDVLDRGIIWDSFVGAGSGMAREIFPYRHVGAAGRFHAGNFDAFTIIPNDVIQLPDSSYVGMGFRVRDWSSGPTQGMCRTISNAWFVSEDEQAEHWHPAVNEDTGAGSRQAARDSAPDRLYEWGSRENRNRYFQNSTFVMVPGEDNLYVFGSREGRKLGFGSEADGVYLRRARWDRCLSHSGWEYFGWSGGRWRWGTDVWPTPLFRPVTPGGHIGELNAQVVGGRVVLTYVDTVLGAVALTAGRPDGAWSAPTVIVSRRQSPCLYAPSVHPWTTDLQDAYLHLSTWQSEPDPGSGRPRSLNYGVQGWQVALESEPLVPSVPSAHPAPSGSVGTGAPSRWSRLVGRVAAGFGGGRRAGDEPRYLGVDTADLRPEDRDAVIERILAASAEVNPGI